MDVAVGLEKWSRNEIALNLSAQTTMLSGD